MPGLDPGIHVFPSHPLLVELARRPDVDRRVKPGDDEARKAIRFDRIQLSSIRYFSRAATAEEVATFPSPS
jgi:hypothetical protein